MHFLFTDDFGNVDVLVTVNDVALHDTFDFLTINVVNYDSVFEGSRLFESENSMGDSLLRSKSATDTEGVVFASVLDLDDFLCLFV
jgi:hypothetical protein